jgi:hypothetical protein
MNETTNNRDEQVKQRAFELWQQHGSQEGLSGGILGPSRAGAKWRREHNGATANSESAKSGSGSDGPG